MVGCCIFHDGRFRNMPGHVVVHGRNVLSTSPTFVMHSRNACTRLTLPTLPLGNISSSPRRGHANAVQGNANAPCATTLDNVGG